MDFGYAEALRQQGRELSRWRKEWRARLAAEFMARHGWKTLAGRGRGPRLRAELRYWEDRQHPYFRSPGHRREHPPNRILLYVLCSRVLWLLEHLRTQGPDDHLVRAHAAGWMLKLVRPVRRHLVVGSGRWTIVRAAVARQAVAVWLGLKPRTLQRKLWNRQRIKEELAAARAESRRGFAFLYVMATRVERRWLLERSAYEACARRSAEFSVRTTDGIAYLRVKTA